MMKNHRTSNIGNPVIDIPDSDRSKFRAKPGITIDVVKEISRQKSEPDWMLGKRLRALKFFENTSIPTWGPPLDRLDLNQITYFVRPDSLEAKEWNDVPQEIRQTFNRLGIPEAEQKMLSGSGAQYDSDVIYHHLKLEWEEKGVVFENMDTALKKYPDLIKKYFMTQCIPINDHKFIMLHGAVWSGGTFIYIPEGVKVDIPMQAYFRMNAQGGGQFEHTLIIADEGSEVHYIEGCSAPIYEKSSLHAGGVEIFVKKGARVRYTSVENWSKNTYNLNTKRALVDEDGIMEWVSGNMGSGTTMLYPCSILRGKRARADHLGVVFAGPGQVQDVGSKVIHAAEETTSVLKSKSISKGGGVSSYRGLVQIASNASSAVSHINCDALLLDAQSKSHTYPSMKIQNSDSQVTHEARVGKISETEIFYLMSRGIPKDQAVQMIVMGFFEPIVKQLDLEYAVEFNKLLELEMERSVG